MIARRTLLTATAAGLGLAGAGALTSNRQAAVSYAEAVQATWRHGPRLPPGSDAGLRELVRYATLAPSSHNTQCWRFALGQRSVAILPDVQRRCPVVDPDDHHLFVSLGCAVENLLLAAAAQGLRGEARYQTAPQEALVVDFEPAPPRPSPLFDAIPQRQSSRSVFEPAPLANADLTLLEAAGSGDGVRVLLLTARPVLETVLEFIVAANTAQLSDPDFMRELKQWIRFNPAEAVSRRDGLFSGSSGNPALPRWLGSRLFDWLVTPQAENAKVVRQLRSSAGVAVFFADQADPAHWIAVGRAFQHFALQATALGLRTAHLNQPVEVAALRPDFARALGVAGVRPDLVIRFGHGPEMPRSLRRPLEAVLEPSA
jgi:nitroreductase